MKKNYNFYITPQNEPQLKLKRLVHFLSCFWLIINCVVQAKIFSEVFLLFLAFVIVFYGFIQQIDRRKSNWTWWGLVLFAIVSVAIPVFLILSYDLYWYLMVIAIQSVISIIIFFIFKKIK